MPRLPKLPSSVLLSRDEEDVFLSFHFESSVEINAELLGKILALWVEAFLNEQGATGVEIFKGGSNG